MKLVLLASSFLAVLAVAQQVGGPQQKGGSVGSAPKKSTPSKTTPRPSPAIGNDIVQVIDSLIAAGAAKGKGEYETTEEYESRSKALCARYGKLTFIVPDVKFTYDADTEKMRLRLSNEYWIVLDDGGASGEKLSLTSKLVQTGSYVAINGYGAKELVRSSTYSVHGIVVSLSSPGSWRFHQGSDAEGACWEHTFSLSVDQARTVKSFLRMLFVCELAEGRVYKGHGGVSPTIDAPLEIKTNGLYIPLLLEEVRVIDIRSGKPIETF